ncbi:hypothetical protein SKAU_G00403270 [Synaphobranchus kaupii]|uniref:KIAA1522 n=1 Tax=Synaphobranchus kaupii TaxID=118154 RepID=A0A9Q1E9J8_SYNKA|nr:hypothetical protein SKAU_G00403270 [Synaphobranchus kaupii]
MEPQDPSLCPLLGTRQKLTLVSHMPQRYFLPMMQGSALSELKKAREKSSRHGAPLFRHLDFSGSRESVHYWITRAHVHHSAISVLFPWGQRACREECLRPRLGEEERRGGCETEERGAQSRGGRHRRRSSGKCVSHAGAQFPSPPQCLAAALLRRGNGALRQRAARNISNRTAEQKRNGTEGGTRLAMSGRNSVGDLVPRDITEILARESKTNKSKRKQGASFSRAFSWLKGTKRKGSSNGQSRGGREGRAGKPTLQDHNSAKAASKQEDERKLTVHYTASQHYQENVFIEGSRPQYLEDLHTEAQEGLKISQQEGHSNGEDYGDDQSTNSAGARLQPEEDARARERKGSLESGSAAAETVSTGSTMSTRSALIRQGSTFKPLNPVKRLDKGRKRSRRTTIMGIPHHVQKELGLERGQLFRQNADGHLRNGGDGAPGIVVIPTIDGEVSAANHEGARVHLQDLEALQSSKEEELLKRHIQAVYRDDLLNHKANPRLSPIQRPKSLAVPGMTTSNFLQEPQGPVMSISPQATYLSKIIPNAIMPAAVDVIEISRSRSRSSVRTVSKSSLATASPASSRSSAPQGLSSDSSNWSHSQSSETIISNSSTISSKGSASTPRAPTATEEAREASQRTATDQVSISSSISWVSSDSTGAKQRVEAGVPRSREVEDAENLQNDRSIVRSLSIVKTKMPPAPPRRTYSLHHEKIKRRSRELMGTKGISDSKSADGNMPWAKGGKSSNAVEEAPSPVTSGSAGSPAYSADSSSLDNSRSSAASSPLSAEQAANREGIPTTHPLSSDSSPQKLPSPANRFERTMSPSSGYSSQSGTPTLSAKEICPSSPGKKKTQPVKPERTVTRSSPAASISSSLTSLSSGASDPTHQEAPANHLPGQLPKPSPPAVVASTKVPPTPAAVMLRDMFDIPPPPKVKAPSPPPPETWMQNKRTFELLCGSSTFAARIAALQQQQQRKEPPPVQKPEAPRAQPQEQDEIAVLLGKEECISQCREESMLSQKPDHSLECASVSLPVRTETGLEVQMKDDKSPVIAKKEKASLVMQNQEDEGPVTQQKEKASPVVLKKEPPPVMRKTIPVIHIKEPVKVLENLLDQSTETTLEVKIHTPPLEESAVQKEETTPNDTGKDPIAEKTTTPQTSMQTLSVDASKQSGVSPPPSPPPAHHPPPPPSKKTTTTSLSSSMPEDNMETPAAESSWPPPPPPMEESSGLIYEGQDEPDFPPPPPPILQDPLLDRAESSPVMTESHELSVTSEGPIKTEESTPGATTEPTKVNSSHPDTSVHIKLCPSPTQPNENDCSSQGVPLVQVPPPPQKGPLVQMEVSPPPQEGSLLQKEVLPPPQEVYDLQEKTVPTHQDATPLKEDIPPPPQEAPPLPPMAPGVTPSAHPVNSSLEPSKTIPTVPSMSVPYAPPLPVENQTHVSFRRQPSLANRASKDQPSRTKSAPMPKEDANIPLVTPSLLQMVRLRSVNVGDDQVLASCEESKPSDGSSPSPDQNQGQAFIQSVPQKPIRKSLSVKSPPGTAASPSMRLQEAIRMKTAAMSSRDGLPARLNLRSSVSSTSCGEMGVRSPRLQEGDLQKSPASTASFIFSRSTKKVIIETPSSPEAQSNLKQSLVAELMQVSDQTKLLSTNGKPSTQTKKLGKVPPPVAKKPAHGPNLSDKPVHPTENTGNSQCELSSSSPMGTNGQTERVQPAGQQAQSEEGQNTASHQETANTVKVTLG